MANRRSRVSRDYRGPSTRPRNTSAGSLRMTPLKLARAGTKLSRARKTLAPRARYSPRGLSVCGRVTTAQEIIYLNLRSDGRIWINVHNSPVPKKETRICKPMWAAAPRELVRHGRHGNNFLLGLVLCICGRVGQGEITPSLALAKHDEAAPPASRKHSTPKRQAAPRLR